MVKDSIPRRDSVPQDGEWREKEKKQRQEDRVYKYCSVPGVLAALCLFFFIFTIPPTSKYVYYRIIGQQVVDLELESYTYFLFILTGGLFGFFISLLFICRRWAKKTPYVGKRRRSIWK
ncbi:MAG: hypothetical protein ACOX6Q_01885 [Candidatus Dojkabacteria bacterium]|jgi:hypothetical protein